MYNSLNDFLTFASHGRVVIREENLIEFIQTMIASGLIEFSVILFTDDAHNKQALFSSSQFLPQEESAE